MEYNDRQKLKTGHHGRQQERPKSHTAPTLGTQPPPGHPNMESSGHTWVWHPAEPQQASLRQPTRSSQWHVTWHEKVECRPGRVQGSPPDPGTRMGWGAALAPGPPASVCVVASRRRHSPIRRGLLPCDCSISAVGTEKFGADQGKGTGWQRGAVVGQCRPIKASGQGVSCTHHILEWACGEGCAWCRAG